MHVPSWGEPVKRGSEVGSVGAGRTPRHASTTGSLLQVTKARPVPLWDEEADCSPVLLWWL